MKTFKHIASGLIAIENSNGYLISFDDRGSITVPAFLIEQGKDWVEEISRLWEILEFKQKPIPENDFSGVLSFLRNPNGTYSALSEKQFTLEHMLADKQYKIEEVKRLSDGEKFRIGDEIKKEKDILKIYFFNVFNNLLNVSCENNRYITNFSIDNLFKAKEIFTTEDGVKIFQNDIYFWVNPDNWRISSEAADSIRTISLISQYSWFKFFSTKELALEYILINEPCLSISDVRRIFIINNSEMNALKEIIKSKQ